jgi:signal transduction histidine kinase
MNTDQTESSSEASPPAATRPARGLGAARALAVHLLAHGEQERTAYARELHDEMGGLLTAMKLELTRLRRLPDLPSPAAERIAALERHLSAGIACNRGMIERLRASTLTPLGLGPSIDLLCTDVATRTALLIETQLDPVADTMRDDPAQVLYLVAREALDNVCRHAQARQVKVRLRCRPGTDDGRPEMLLAIEDDGQGFQAGSTRNGQHGLASLRLRLHAAGGHLSVRSRIGHGTRVQARMPLRQPCQDTPPA